MGNYAGFVTKARNAIRAKGTTTTLRRTVPGTYDAVTGVMTGSSVVTQEVYVVSFPKVRLIEDKIKHFSKIYLALPVEHTITPQTADELWIGGRWLVLPTSTPLNPDDSANAIMYEVEVEL